jgi:Ras GTPase-activating-like protein IQGAP2/3
VQAKPIYISPNEVYAMHGLLSEHLDHLVNDPMCTHITPMAECFFQAPERDDPLRAIILELGGVPHLGGSDELKDARETVVTLELTNRFAHVRGGCY